jgi:hypothetical protein
MAFSGNQQESSKIAIKLPIGAVAKDVRYPIFYSEKGSLSCFILYDTYKKRIEAVELNKNHDSVDSFLGMSEDEVGSIVIHTKDKVAHIESKVAMPITSVEINKFFSLKKGEVISVWNNSYKVETCYKGFVFIKVVN